MTPSLTTETDEVHELIANGVASLEEADPLELPPLYDAVDPDALEALFAPPEQGGPRMGKVEFPYAGYTVTVEFNNGVIVTIE